MPRIKASLLYFVIVLGTGFAMGVVRVPFLVPRLGERYAELLEMPIMLVVIVLAARHVVRRFKLAPNPTVRLQSQLLGQYIASRDPVSGSVYVLLLLVFALMPALLMRVGVRQSRRGNDS